MQVARVVVELRTAAAGELTQVEISATVLAFGAFKPRARNGLAMVMTSHGLIPSERDALPVNQKNGPWLASWQPPPRRAARHAQKKNPPFAAVTLLQHVLKWRARDQLLLLR